MKEIDPLLEAVRAAFRAIAGEDGNAPELHFREMEETNMKPEEIEYFPETNTIIISLPERPFTEEKIKYIRGISDLSALKYHYHDEKRHLEKMPKTDSARAIFDAAEESRLKLLGSRDYSGLKENLESYTNQHWQKMENEKFIASDINIIADVMDLLITAKHGGFKIPESAEKAMNSYGRWIAGRLDDELENLGNHIDSQHDFAKAVIKLIQKMQMLGNAVPEQQKTMKSERLEEQPEQGENQEGEYKSKFDDLKATSFGEEEQGADKSEKTMQSEGEGDKKEVREEKEVPRERTYFYTNQGKIQPYHSYTTQFDRVVEPKELASSEELTRLRAQLDSKLAEVKNITSKLAAKLQRKLLSTQARAWDFNLEEGALDPKKLDHVIVDPFYPYLYRWEKQTPFNNTLVTMLIDNSGSMRGRPIMVASLCADIMARTLERCRIKTEVLGFTTSEWKGGKSRKLWLKNNSPANPGRLNDLLHIVYKSADTPWHRSKKNLGLMLKEGLLKENIDGEAILFACKRMSIRPEKRRILMVISDGAPVDDSTLSANNGNYLDHHLHEVIHTVENNTDIELLAIGIGHDVTQYYKKAVTIRDVEQLGDAMVGQLSELFEPGYRVN